ncbi:putative PurR-regulated permease PerM [Bradyrhizobium sp. USDA 4463]
MSPLPRQPFKARTTEELIGILSTASAAILAVIIIATLYFGRDIFVPVALAVLLSFVLAPVVGLLQRIHVPRGLAVVGVVILAFGLIFAMGSLLATQLTQLAGDLPRYQSTISEKIQSFRNTKAGRGTLERASDMLKDLGKELDKPKDTAVVRVPGLTAGRTISAPPVPVEVRQPDPGALESLRSLISPLIHPLATTGIIIIFVIFILVQREDLRNRLIRLAGSSDLQRTTAALDDAASRLSKLFLTQLILNGAFGAVIGTGLWFIGIPSAILWGILAAALRFVPYIGAVIAAAFPLALAVALDPGWSMLLWTLALFVVVEPIAGHVIEPMVYGHSTGLSPVAVLASATFWTALWGPIGLVLATPLTVCLVVLGRHVERLEFLDVMFGDRPALAPSELFFISACWLAIRQKQPRRPRNFLRSGRWPHTMTKSPLGGCTWRKPMPNGMLSIRSDSSESAMRSASSSATLPIKMSGRRRRARRPWIRKHPLRWRAFQNSPRTNGCLPCAKETSRRSGRAITPCCAWPDAA